MSKGWIGFDLDGTLAVYDGFKGASVIGEPIKPMVDLLKDFLAKGHQVKIFTARVWSDGTPSRNNESYMARTAILAWCKEHIGLSLPITCIKDYSMWALFDDRAIQVERNTGIVLGNVEAVIPTPTDP